MLFCDVLQVVVVGLFLIQTSHAAGYECEVPQTRPANESYTRLCLPASEVNRTFGFSGDAPIARGLSAQPWGTYGLLQILAHFEAEGARVRALARRKRELFVRYVHEACNVHVDEAEVGVVNRFLSELGLGLLRTRCVTELVTERARTPVAAMRMFVRELGSVGVAASGWDRAYTYQTYRYADATDRCEVIRVSAVRSGGQWAVHAGVTSRPVAAFGARMQVVELVRMGTDGNLIAVPLTLRNESDGAWGAATTLKEVRGGVHGTSLFDEREVVARNPAVVAAMRMRAHQRQQVVSYTSPALLAVIAIPILSSLVPVAYFTDLSTPATLAYTVVKDVVNAAPMIIKGAELILFGTGYVPQATRTWVWGGAASGDVAVAETWFAMCRANAHVIWTGRVLVVVAVLITACSIGMELWVIRVVKVRRRKWIDKEIKQRLEEGRQLWSGAFCTQCSFAEKEIEAVATCQLEMGIK